MAGLVSSNLFAPGAPARHLLQRRSEANGTCGSIGLDHYDRREETRMTVRGGGRERRSICRLGRKASHVGSVERLSRRRRAAGELLRCTIPGCRGSPVFLYPRGIIVPSHGRFGARKTCEGEVAGRRRGSLRTGRRRGGGGRKRGNDFGGVILPAAEGPCLDLGAEFWI